jgi:hypothetical protein
MSPRPAAKTDDVDVDAEPEAPQIPAKAEKTLEATLEMSNPPEAAATTDEGSADGAVVGTKRKAEDSTFARDASTEALPANGLQIDRTEGPPGKSSVCRVEGCDVVFSTAHECRARACQKHCSALFVRLKGAGPDEHSRFCYQCHKFHPMDNFRGADGTLLPRHNCSQSQVQRLERRKRKDALKASKKMAEALGLTHPAQIHAVNLLGATNVGQLLLANQVASQQDQLLALIGGGGMAGLGGAGGGMAGLGGAGGGMAGLGGGGMAGLGGGGMAGLSGAGGGAAALGMKGLGGAGGGAAALLGGGETGSLAQNVAAAQNVAVIQQLLGRQAGVGAAQQQNVATIQQLLGGQSGAPQQNVATIQQLLGGQSGAPQQNVATIQQLLGGQAGAAQQNVSAIQQLLGGQAGVGAAQQNVGQTPQQESLYQAVNQKPLSGQMSQLDMLAAIQQQQQHLAILNAVGGAKGGAAGAQLSGLGGQGGAGVSTMLDAVMQQEAMKQNMMSHRASFLNMMSGAQGGAQGGAQLGPIDATAGLQGPRGYGDYREGLQGLQGVAGTAPGKNGSLLSGLMGQLGGEGTKPPK